MIIRLSLYITLIFLKFSLLVTLCNSLCLDANNRVKWNRNFHFKNKEIPLTLDVSSRASHQILSQVVKILLQERLGYKHVELKYHKDNSIDGLLDRLSCVDSSCVNGNPVSHINVELWIYPSYSFSDRHRKQTIDCGPLGPTARKGVFVDSERAKRIFNDNEKIIDYWKILAQNDRNCETGNRKSCFKIVYNNNTNFINEFGKISSVLYPNTTIAVKPLSDVNIGLKRSVQETDSNELFWNWYPNVATVQGNFTRVLFPDCWGSYRNTTCDFEVNQLTKVVWSHIKDRADKAYFLITELKFSHDEFVALLKDVNVSEIDDRQEYYNVACKWIRNNPTKWFPWTAGWNVKDQIYMPVLVSNYAIWKAVDTINASLYGIDIVNNHVINGTHYKIIPEVRKLECDEDVILSSYLNLIERYDQKIIGFIVCLCPRTFNSLIKISDMQNRIILSSSIESTHSMNLTEYKYFFSTQPNMYHYNLVLIKMFHRFNWTRVVILKKDDDLLNEKILPRYNIKVLASLTIREDQIDYDKAYRFLEMAQREHKAGVFLIDYLVHGTQVVMCAAGNLGMTLTTDYAFVLNPSIDPYWYVNSTSKHCQFKKNVSSEFFIIKHDVISEHIDGYIRNNIIKFNHLAQITQNAIVYLGQSFKELLEAIPSAYYSLHQPPVSEKFVNLLAIQSQRMLGANGTYNRRMFNKNHERQGIWKVQRVAYSHKYLLARTILTWNIDLGFETEAGLPKIEELVAIETLKLPKDTNSLSDCPVEVLRYLFGWSCTATEIFINLFCIAFVISLLVVGLVWYYRRQSAIMEDRYKKPFDDLCAELADIDIRSSDVVISLQVGKGAFGIVYGGEAKRNTRWESVAIKLIKKEADYQGKIDFLTEAKLMRNLDHPNIVKLIGICLNPLRPAIYLVMELVVNGDLEDYLLTNRITANKDPTNKSVCPSLLTRFVSNIASGTEYLHKCSLLHRDLACRNCFLSEDYVVKIGDFGLTRNINESQVNQYYRTARHFVLPARWMPPEAVQFGYFSIQSDIWSLGVVIFEVVTFCSRPYFNFTDEEVPELVKRNTMPLVNYLPEEAKDSDVYKLIEKCCQYRRDDRPKSMGEIVDILTERPECIRPYITSNPPQAASVGVWMNPNDFHQRPSSLASGGLNRFKSTSRSRTSVSNWGIFSDSHPNFDSIIPTESDIGRVTFPGNPDQVPFIPNEAEFITIDHITNRIGSKKRQKNNKKVSSNLNTSKSRSSDFMTNKIDDDQEPSYVSCPDQGHIHGLGDFDAQDFPFNDNCKPFIRSASGDEKSITSAKRRKTIRNGKMLYKGSSRSHKAKSNKYGAMASKSKSRLNSLQPLEKNRKISDANGVRTELIQPLLYERAANVSIQPKRGKNFKNCFDDEVC